MEKIVNVQAKAVQQAQMLPIQQAGSKDDFMKLLNQQKVLTEQTSQTQKSDRPKNADTADETVKKASEGSSEEPKEAADPAEEDMQQLAMEQAAAQLAGMVTDVQEQMLPPTEVTEFAVDSSVTVAEEAGLISMADTGENMAVQSQAKETTPVLQNMSETAQEPVQEQAVTAIQEESYSAAENSAQESQEDVVLTKADEEVGAPVNEEVHKNEASGNAAYAVQAAVQNTEDARPIQIMQTPAAETGTQDTVVTSTVEELPQQLGNALSSGQTGNGQTLTIELEPASLGKLTIRLEYEAGRTALSIIASNPKTLELLNAKASEIASILKDRTGEETVIYTQEPQQESAEQYKERQNDGRGSQDERQPQEQKSEQQTESFAQQLRLGLV